MTPTKTDSEREREDSRGERDDSQLESTAGKYGRRCDCVQTDPSLMCTVHSGGQPFGLGGQFLGQPTPPMAPAPVMLCSPRSAADCGPLFQVVAGCCGWCRLFPVSSPPQILCNVAVIQARISQGESPGHTMSRGLDLDRDDERAREEEDERRAKEARGAHRLLRDDDARDPDRRSEQLPSRDFALPDGRERETVHLRAWGCRLRDTEGRTLVAAGAFRMVFERDLRDGVYRGDAERLAQDVKALRAQGLLDRRTLAVDDRGHSMGVLALTERGRALLEARRYRDPDDGPEQAVYSGWHKPAEVIHDASLYRMF